MAEEVKSSWSPPQKMQWLGFNTGLLDGCITVPDKQICALQSILLTMVGKECIQAMQLASMVEKIIAMTLALGPVARLMTRSLYALLQPGSHGVSLCRRLLKRRWS